MRCFTVSNQVHDFHVLAQRFRYHVVHAHLYASDPKRRRCLRKRMQRGGAAVSHRHCPVFTTRRWCDVYTMSTDKQSDAIYMVRYRLRTNHGRFSISYHCRSRRFYYCNNLKRALQEVAMLFSERILLITTFWGSVQAQTLAARRFVLR